MKPTITWNDFEKIDFRLGTIMEVSDNVKARNPAYILKVDMGSELGIKQSSAQLTALYSKEDLIGKQVLCVVNFEAKRIAGVKSEILITGFYDEHKNVVLSGSDRPMINGSKLG